MNPNPPVEPIRESDLHAYVDDQLPETRRLEVDAYLRDHPEDAARVAAWRRDGEELRALLDPVAHEAIPMRIPASQPRAARWRPYATAAAIAIVSVTAGWMGRGAMEGPADIDHNVAMARAPAFAQRAAVAHVVYTPDARRPVEVGADQRDQLVTWLSKRMETRIQAPDLRTSGYELVGGRLLPGERGPAAQFMYQDGTGKRLTLYVSRDERPNDAREFRFEQNGPVNLFYWVDESLGYAIAAGAPRADLERIAGEVHRQLQRG
jgi:anti-sigma factor RsiW